MGVGVGGRVLEFLGVPQISLLSADFPFFLTPLLVTQEESLSTLFRILSMEPYVDVLPRGQPPPLALAVSISLPFLCQSKSLSPELDREPV